MTWLNQEQLEQMNFACLGQNVMLSNKASFYNCSKISIGDNVRIDDFCVLSAGEGGIEIGSYVHLAVYTSLIGQGKITLEDFSNISSRVAIYSSSDDFSGETMTNPMIPESYKNVLIDDVYIGKHVVIGSGSVLLPGVSIRMGAAVGALSLVKEDIDEFEICAGIPARTVGSRSNNLINIEQQFMLDNK